MTMTAVAARVDNLLRLDADPDEMFSNIPKISGEKVLMALDHFARSTHHSIGPPTSGKLMRGGVMELAMRVCLLFCFLLLIVSSVFMANQY